MWDGVGMMLLMPRHEVERVLCSESLEVAESSDLAASELARARVVVEVPYEMRLELRDGEDGEEEDDERSWSWVR